MKTINISEETYEKIKDQILENKGDLMIQEGESAKLFRADRAGVFAGNLKEIEKGTQYSRVIIENCRRIWYWDGASTLSQLADEGVKRPENCKFPKPVKEIEVFGVIEITSLSKQAIQSINEVKIWEE